MRLAPPSQDQPVIRPAPHAARASRRLPRLYGLAIAVGFSAACWIGLAALARALLR